MMYRKNNNLFDPELHLIKTKPQIKNKLKALLNELKKFKVPTTSVIDYKTRNNRKIFHSSTKLIACDSDIDGAFKSMPQSVMTKRKNYAIIKHSLKILECQYKERFGDKKQFYTD